MTTLLHDLRYSLRLFLRNPGFVAVALVSARPGHRSQHHDLQRVERGSAARSPSQGPRQAGRDPGGEPAAGRQPNFHLHHLRTLEATGEELRNDGHGRPWRRGRARHPDRRQAGGADQAGRRRQGLLHPHRRAAYAGARLPGRRRPARSRHRPGPEPPILAAAVRRRPRRARPQGIRRRPAVHHRGGDAARLLVRAVGQGGGRVERLQPGHEPRTAAG